MLWDVKVSSKYVAHKKIASIFVFLFFLFFGALQLFVGIKPLFPILMLKVSNTI